MTIFYRMILGLYPVDYRKAFAGEMIETFERAKEDAANRGNVHLVRFALREVAGLLRGLLLQRLKARPFTLCLADRYGAWETVQLTRQIEKSIRCIEVAIAHHDFQKARFYSYAERAARRRLEQLASE